MKPFDPFICHTPVPLFISLHAVLIASAIESHFTGIGTSTQKMEYVTAVDVNCYCPKYRQLMSLRLSFHTDVDAGRVRTEMVLGTSHFLPMERPEMVRSALVAAVFEERSA